jgi:hypothetical protein
MMRRFFMGSDGAGKRKYSGELPGYKPQIYALSPQPASGFSGLTACSRSRKAGTCQVPWLGKAWRFKNFISGERRLSVAGYDLFTKFINY